jgi:hypothetical protein
MLHDIEQYAGKILLAAKPISTATFCILSLLG